MSLRDQFQESKLAIESVDTPEWGGDGKTYIRALSVDEIFELQEALSKRHKDKPSPGVILAFTVCEPDGTRTFTEDDIDLINRQAARPVLRVAEAASKLNKLEPEAADAAVADAEKNSAAGRTE